MYKYCSGKGEMLFGGLLDLKGFHFLLGKVSEGFYAQQIDRRERRRRLRKVGGGIIMSAVKGQPSLCVVKDMEEHLL